VNLGRHKEDWERLAQVDPLWAVLTVPGRKGGGWDEAAFFATGEAEVAAVFERADGLARPARRERALDFGSGVGRLTRALGSRFDAVVGIDISAEMIQHARRLNEDYPACEFRINMTADLSQLESNSFDFVYSSMVLQHLPSAAHVERYLAELIRVARPDGLVVFGLPNHVPFPYSLQPRRRLYALLRGLGVSEQWMLMRTSLTPMRMTPMPHADVQRVLAQQDARLLDTETADGRPVRERRYYVAPTDAMSR
jgi:2-polyprenyl-3-methyl-5-hydroxy-6-metoxy-1,4-benzoquinol methylase